MFIAQGPDQIGRGGGQRRKGVQKRFLVTIRAVGEPEHADQLRTVIQRHTQEGTHGRRAVFQGQKFAFIFQIIGNYRRTAADDFTQDIAFVAKLGVVRQILNEFNQMVAALIALSNGMNINIGFVFLVIEDFGNKADIAIGQGQQVREDLIEHRDRLHTIADEIRLGA